MMKRYDYLVVGSGLFGATFAHCATKAGKRCLVIDRREHLGGNLRCITMEGINVHVYGAHIFHTSNKEVWDFVNSIVPFNRYTNSPVANYQGRLYNLPFNMNTFYQMWGVSTPEEARGRIDEQRYRGVVRNLEQQARSLVGDDIFERLIKGYTEKQWGRDCCDLPPFIIRRLPLRFVFDNNYFNDAYQGIPIGGYNRLTFGLLEGTDCRTGVDFFRDIDNWHLIADKLVFTGRIDEFYGFKLGKLEYRTVRFDTEVIDSANFQGNAVVNYTEREVPFTRIIEHKHFESFGEQVYANPKTVISREYPMEWREGLEPFYPVNDDRNNTLYSQYRQLADRESDVIFGGRLAEYKYYDMAPIIEKVLRLVKGGF